MACASFRLASVVKLICPLAWMLSVRALCFLDWGPVSLELGPGEIACLRGRSGSGKSLLLRAIADLIPHEGEIALEARALDQTPPSLWRRQVGYLAAEPLWWEDLVGEHFLAAPSRETLGLLGLEPDCLAWESSRLSMGERQRLGLLRLLDRSPRVLLLDEATANLDAEARAAVESLLADFVRREQACALWATHDAEQALRLAQRTFVMEEKRLERQL